MNSQWPARLTYLTSRPALEKMAAEVRAGRALSAPKRIGLIVIERAELGRNGIVCLWTDPQPGGNAGFVQCDSERAESFGLFGHIRLDDRWQFIRQD